MKKVLVLSLVAGMFVLAACGSGSTKPAVKTDSVVEKKVAVDTTKAAAAPADTTKAAK